jgi:hypothetical protein
MNPLKINGIAPIVMSIPLLFALACRLPETVDYDPTAESEPILEPKPTIAPITIWEVAGSKVQRNQAVFNASKDRIWPIIVAQIVNNYPIHTLDKASGSITTQAVQITPTSFFEFTFEGQRALTFLTVFNREFEAAERNYINSEAAWAERESKRFNEWLDNQRMHQTQSSDDYESDSEYDNEYENEDERERSSYRNTAAINRVKNIVADLNKAVQVSTTVREGLSAYRASLVGGTEPAPAQTPALREQQRILREKDRELQQIKAQEQERTREEAKIWPLKTWTDGGRIWYIHILAVEDTRNRTTVTVKCHFPLAPEQQLESSGVLENRILTQFEKALKN